MEHDSCGVAFVADLKGRASHRLVQMGLDSLCHLEHRGAKGADPSTGDGAGVLVQLPDRYLRSVVPGGLPPKGCYVTGVGFVTAGPAGSQEARRRFGEIAAEEGLDVLSW